MTNQFLDLNLNKRQSSNSGSHFNSWAKSKMKKDPSGLTGIMSDNKSNFQWIAYKQK